MKHIVAIGGGEIGRPGFPVETTEIDKHIIDLTNKYSPNVLFIPTASGDSVGYSAIFTQYYGDKLGCKVDGLNLYKKPSLNEIEEKLSWSDIVYVGGGNTLKMMMWWRRLGVDELLITAHPNGKVLSGLSAGAICWFNGGLSDSRSLNSKGQDRSYINVHGINLENILLCPHFDAEPARQPVLKNSLQGTRKIAIALDNCAALEVKDSSYRILASKNGAKGYKAQWLDGDYQLKPLLPSMIFMPLSDITN